ncbi:MAG: DNA primase [Candidatus Moranbacteria bacterium RBG_13_45_13]|nr:MAG: DNA primase [Candidatus Moranbacteria bacterium RBG_13_45_13]
MVSEERRSFHCFGCGKGGDIFTFVMEMEGIGFREALSQLAEKAGVQLKKWEAEDKKQEAGRKKLYQILELATKWYEKNLWEGKGKEKILGYLHERGLTDEIIKKFRLGYAPEGWRNILCFLTKRDFDIDEIERTGLLVERNSKSETLNPKQIQNSKFKIQNSDYYDRFRDRIMFPVQNVMGRVVGFSARVAPGGDEKTAKYINTPQTELYDKSRVLYGMNLAKTEIKKGDEVVLVEGNMDVIASHLAGFPNTIAVSGTALAPEQIKSIKRYTENIKMAFDMDSAGQAAAKRSARVCLENDLNVRIVLLPQGKDAADVIREDKKVWQKAIVGARGVVEYFFEDAFSRYDSKKPTDKKKIAKDLLNIIKDIASPIEKSHWIKVLSQKLDVPEKALLEVLERTDKSRKVSRVKEEKETPERTKKDRLLEKRIIGLILAFPRETEKIRDTMNEDTFSGDLEKKIWKVAVGKGREFDFEEIKNSISDYESQKLLDEAVFEVEVEVGQRGDRIFDPARELVEANEQLKKIRVREKILRIAKEIKRAEESGDKGAIKSLMNEFQNLSAEIGK